MSLTYRDFINEYPQDKEFAKAAYAMYLLDKGETAVDLNVRTLAASKIKWNDTADTLYTLSGNEQMEYIGKSGKTSSYYYRAVKDAFIKMDSKQEWMEMPSVSKLIKWFDKLVITKGSGEIKYKFNERFFPYLKLYMYSIYGRLDKGGN